MPIIEPPQIIVVIVDPVVEAPHYDPQPGGGNVQAAAPVNEPVGPQDNDWDGIPGWFFDEGDHIDNDYADMPGLDSIQIQADPSRDYEPSDWGGDYGRDYRGAGEDWDSGSDADHNFDVDGWDTFVGEEY